MTANCNVNGSKLCTYCNDCWCTQTCTCIRGIARIMENIGTSRFVEGPGGEPPPQEAHQLYNRKGNVFDSFGSALNNMKFRLFCTFLTIPLWTNKNFNVIDYPDTFIADGRMVTLLYTLRNFNELFIVFHLYNFMKSQDSDSFH